MRYKALAFGAIGVLAETSELQRQAYNLAFRQSGLDWDWDAETYMALLHRPGGVRRIAEYAQAQGDIVLEPEAVHARKVANFRSFVVRDGLTLRTGVLDIIAAAERRALPIAWATTTGAQTLDLMFDGFAGQITRDQFRYIADRSHVTESKPAPDVYHRVILELGVPADQILAVEDTPESAEAARAAGIDVLGFAGLAAQGRQFPDGVVMVDRLTPDHLLDVATA